MDSLENENIVDEQSFLEKESRLSSNKKRKKAKRKKKRLEEGNDYQKINEEQEKSQEPIVGDEICMMEAEQNEPKRKKAKKRAKDSQVKEKYDLQEVKEIENLQEVKEIENLQEVEEIENLQEVKEIENLLEIGDAETLLEVEEMETSQEVVDTENLQEGEENCLDDKIRTPRRKRLNAVDADDVKVVSLLSSEDVKELINRIIEETPVHDKIRVSSREQQINWDRISFSHYSASVCRKSWERLKLKARKHRIVREIANEILMDINIDKDKFANEIITSLPGYPKMPPTAGGAYRYFLHEFWEAKRTECLDANVPLPDFTAISKECSALYSKLSPQRKLEYSQKAELVLADHKRRVKEFFHLYKQLPKAGTSTDAGSSTMKTASMRTKFKEILKSGPVPPRSPGQMFVEHKLNKKDPPPIRLQLNKLKQRYIAKWKKLPPEKKLKWINKVVELSVEHVEKLQEYTRLFPGYKTSPFRIKGILTSKDIEIWEAANGKPKSPPLTVFQHYLINFQNSEEAKSIDVNKVSKVAAAKFKALLPHELELQRAEYTLNQAKYKQEIIAYYSKLPSVLRVMCLDTIGKKFRPLLLRVDKVPKDDLSKSHPGENTLEGDDCVPPNQQAKGEDDNEAQEFSQPETSSHEKITSRRKRHRVLTSKYMSKRPDVDKFQTIGSDQITQKNVSDAIRGIFDGRTYLGRQFSAYYYYAKYVSEEVYWINLVGSLGVVEAAVRMIECFHSLPDYQKDNFLRESYKFYLVKNFGNKMSLGKKFTPRDLVSEHYPGEPEKPPMSPKDTYVYEMEIQKGLKNYEQWQDLSNERRSYYLNKFYQAHCVYRKDYQKFIMEMTYNDLAEYACHRAIVKSNSQFRAVGSVGNLADNLSIPEDEFHLQSENTLPILTLHSKQSKPAASQVMKNNPLANEQLMLLLEEHSNSAFRENVKIKKVCKDDCLTDSDVPSAADDDDDPENTIKKEIEEAELYYYPIEDVLYRECYDRLDTSVMREHKMTKLQFIRAKFRESWNPLKEQPDPKVVATEIIKKVKVQKPCRNCKIRKKNKLIKKQREREERELKRMEKARQREELKGQREELTGQREELTGQREDKESLKASKAIEKKPRRPPVTMRRKRKYKFHSEETALKRRRPANSNPANQKQRKPNPPPPGARRSSRIALKQVPPANMEENGTKVDSNDVVSETKQLKDNQADEARVHRCLDNQECEASIKKETEGVLEYQFNDQLSELKDQGNQLHAKQGEYPELRSDDSIPILLTESMLNSMTASKDEAKTDSSRDELKTDQSRDELKADQSRDELKTDQSRDELKTDQSRDELKTDQSRGEARTDQFKDEPFLVMELPIVNPVFPSFQLVEIEEVPKPELPMKQEY